MIRCTKTVDHNLKKVNKAKLKLKLNVSKENSQIVNRSRLMLCDAALIFID